MTREEFCKKWESACEPHCHVNSKCLIRDMDSVIETESEEDFKDWEKECDARKRAQEDAESWRRKAIVWKAVAIAGACTALWWGVAHGIVRLWGAR